MLACNYLFKSRYMYTRYCNAISSKFVAMASFANVVQSTELRLGANYFSQYIICIYARQLMLYKTCYGFIYFTHFWLLNAHAASNMSSCNIFSCKNQVIAPLYSLHTSALVLHNSTTGSRQ